MAKLRGSTDVKTKGIAESLRLCLESSSNEKELRQLISWFIGYLEAEPKKIKRATAKDFTQEDADDLEDHEIHDDINEDRRDGSLV